MEYGELRSWIFHIKLAGSFHRVDPASFHIDIKQIAFS